MTKTKIYTTSVNLTNITWL